MKILLTLGLQAYIYIYTYTYTNWPEALLEVFVGADGALGAAATDHWLSLFSPAVRLSCSAALWLSL